MANVNRPAGFIPKRHQNGSPYNGQFQIFYVEAGDTTAIYIGDVVKHASTSGAAGVRVSGMDMEGVPAVTRVTTGVTGQDIVGVVKGFLVDPTNLALKHRSASTARVVLVVTDPSVIYEVQEDATTTPIVRASVGLNASFSVTAGSTTTGVSGMELISASVATTTTIPLKVLGLSKKVDNAFNTGGSGTDKAKFEVMFNTYLWAPNIAGV